MCVLVRVQVAGLMLVAVYGVVKAFPDPVTTVVEGKIREGWQHLLATYTHQQLFVWGTPHRLLRRTPNPRPHPPPP